MNILERFRNWIRKGDGFVDVPLREGEISHKVRGNEHEVVLRAMTVCHYCRAPIQKLGDPCPYNCPGYMKARTDAQARA